MVYRSLPTEFSEYGRRGQARVGLLAALGAAVVLIALGAIALRFLPSSRPTAGDESRNTAVEKPSESFAVTSSSAKVNTANSAADVRPSSSIMLAESPVPADAEQLQDEARRTTDTLRQRFPQTAEALHVAAMMHAQFRQTADAESLWKQCVDLKPSDDRYRVNLAAVAMDRGNSALAIEVLRGASDDGSRLPDVSYHLGVALTNVGQNEEAEQILANAVKQFPDSPPHWLVLGQAQLKGGRAEDAESSLRRAIDLGVESPNAFFALANACARQGKQEDAAKYRERFAELSEGQALDPNERFQILSTAEARRSAVAVLSEAAAVHAANSDTLEAERLLLRALALDPASIDSCRTLAQIYQQADMPAEERVVRDRLIKLQPFVLNNYLDLARVSARLGDDRAAEAALKAAVSVAPQVGGPYTTLAQYYLQAGNAGKARWYAQEAVRREPTADGYVLLGSTCRLLGDDASAEAAFAEATRLDPNRMPSRAGNARDESKTP